MDSTFVSDCMSTCFWVITCVIRAYHYLINHLIMEWLPLHWATSHRLQPNNWFSSVIQMPPVATAPNPSAPHNPTVTQRNAILPAGCMQCQGDIIQAIHPVGTINARVILYKYHSIVTHHSKGGTRVLSPSNSVVITHPVSQTTPD